MPGTTAVPDDSSSAQGTDSDAARRRRDARRSVGFVALVVALAAATGIAIGVNLIIGALIVVAVGVFVAIRTLSLTMLLQHWSSPLLHLLVFSVFIESVTIGGVTVGRVLSAVCVVVIFVGLLIEGRAVPLGVLVRCLPALAFALLYAISGFWSESRSGWLFSMFQIALALAYFSAVIVLLPKQDPGSAVRPMLRTYVLGSIFAGLYGLSQLGTLPRAVGLQGDPNIYAMYQVAAIPAAIALARHRRYRWAWLLTIIVSVSSVLASGSRGGVIATAATLLACAVFMAPRRWRRPLMGVGLLGGVLMTLLSYQTNSRAGNVADDRASGRIDIWHVAWVTFTENPFLGIGSGQFKLESIRLLTSVPGVELLRSHLLSGKGIEVHNLYLEALVERGIIGLLVLLLLLGSGMWFLITARTPRHPEISALLPMLVAFSVATFFLSIPNNKLLWILLGLGVVLARPQTGSSRPDPAQTARERDRKSQPTLTENGRLS